MKNRIVLFSVLLSLFSSCTSAQPIDVGDDRKKDEIIYTGTVETYRYFVGLAPSLRYTVDVNGEHQFVYPTTDQDICIFGCRDTVCVEIGSPSCKIESAVVRPLGKKIPFRIIDGRIVLYMAEKDRFVVDINGDNGKESLILFANPVDKSKPSRDDPGVKYFESGKIHTPGAITLKSDETLYIEGGAIVKSNVRAESASSIRIAGGGILISSPDENRPINFNNVTRSRVEGITVINASNWSTVYNLCDGIELDNVKVYATPSLANESGNENDGMDLMACNNFNIRHCFSCCYDDTYCIKTQKWGYCGTTTNISYEDCIAWNKGGGNSFEIGYELNQDVTHVTYKDIYSIHSASRIGSSGPFRRGAITIHCGAGGTVSDITYENVHIEDPAIYGIHMQILKTGYEIGTGVEWSPGKVTGVRIKNVYMAYMPKWYNVIKGYDAEHKIEAEIDGLYIGGNRIRTLSDGKFETAFANIVIK